MPYYSQDDDNQIPGIAVGAEDLDEEQLKQLIEQARANPALQQELESRLSDANSRATAQQGGGPINAGRYIVPDYGSAIAGAVGRYKGQKEATDLRSQLEQATSAQQAGQSKLDAYKFGVDRSDRAQTRQDRLAQLAQAQSNADRGFGLQEQQLKASRDDAASNNTFRQQQLQDNVDLRHGQQDLQRLQIESARQASQASTREKREKASEGPRNELQKVDSGLSLVGEASQLLTGDEAPDTNVFSRAGRSVAAAFGQATPGSRTNARLKSIGSLLVQAAPRLGGATSDRDVLLYQEAAGTLNDPSIPNEEKLAALDTLKGVMERNKEHFSTEVRRAGGGGGVRFDPATGKLVDDDQDTE